MLYRDSFIAGRLPGRQRGAVLMFSLIVLILLTLIGVTAMQTTTMQERMAGGQRDHHLALQGAEAALRQAERGLNQAVVPTATGQNGYYSYLGPEAPRWTAFDQASPIQYSGGDGDGTLGGLLAEPPEYYLELRPPSEIGTSLAADEAVADSEIYRVTARSTGGSGNAVIIIQSDYRR